MRWLERDEIEAIELDQIARAALNDLARAHDDDAVTIAAFAERWRKWRPAFDDQTPEERVAFGWAIYKHIITARGGVPSWATWMRLLNQATIEATPEELAAEERAA